jgi:iron(II)-dependent oxidoreductase
MHKTRTTRILAAAVIVSAAVLVFAWTWTNPAGAVIGGLLAVSGVAALLPAARRAPPRSPAPPEPAPPARPQAVKVAEPGDLDALIEQMLAQGRYALMLRPQIAPDLAAEQFEKTLEALQVHMALVPEGAVVLGEAAGLDEQPDADHGRLRRQRTVRVAPYFLDRYPVTNRQYYEFVASGGYQQISFWDTAIWPAVLDFVDQTREPGPRFWRRGCYCSGEENHPVVGICWYEASAYARWVGKRLPSDAEWVKAGAWPVALSDRRAAQRKFPWGDTMDRSKANLWGSGPGRTLPVTDLADGVSVGGIFQLIGNVWEWTRSDYTPGHFPHEEFIAESPLKSIRGGAFDTYFDNQATCQFQSGDVQIARKRNIGFRCALSVCDLTLYREAFRNASGLEAPVEEVKI